MNCTFRRVAAGLLFFLVAAANAAYDDYQSLYLKNVNLPSCDPSRSEVLIIRDSSDWSKINASGKRVFCVEPGNYSSAGTILLTASGSASEPRVIRLTGSSKYPWTVSKSNRAIIKAIHMVGADNWIVHGLVVTNPSYDIDSKALVEIEKDSDNIVLDKMLIEDAAYRLVRIGKGSDNVTVQRSVIRHIRVPILGNYGGLCVSLQVNDEYGDTRNVHIVDSEIYGCGGDSIQMRSNTKDNPAHGFRGVVIENNDLFVPREYYTNCATGELDPNGNCACSENSVDIKINFIGNTPSKKDIAQVIHNRMWGHRSVAKVGSVCGTTSSVYSPAIVLHFAEADYVLIKDNIIMDSENGIWMTKTGVDHVSVIGNLFHDVANKRKPRGVLAVDAGNKFEAYYNAIVDSDRYLLTGDGSGIDLRNNLVLNSGTWIPQSSSGDYSASEAKIGNNYYYKTSAYDGSAAIGNDIVRSSVEDARTNTFCFIRNKLTSPNQYCVPNVRSGGSSPHVGRDDVTAGSIPNIGIDDYIFSRSDIWDEESDQASNRPMPPSLD